MLICKSCGASVDANSSVCEKCGASLRRRSKKKPTEYKDIYSNTNPSKSAEVTSDSMDVFSSGEMFEKAKKDQVLDKIYKQELALGEVPTIPLDSEFTKEPEPFKPTVINRETTSDIVSSHKSGKKNKSDHSGKIPQRVIESSRPQKESENKASGKKNASKGSKPAGDQKQKQKTQQPKTAVKEEVTFFDEPGKKSKPADEELVELTPMSVKPKKNTGSIGISGNKTVQKGAPVPVVKNEDGIVSVETKEKPANIGKEKTDRDPIIVKAEKPTNKPEGDVNKKKQKAANAERPLQKSAVSGAAVKKVKSDKLSEKENVSGDKSADDVSVKKKPVVQKENKPVREKKVPVKSDKKPEVQMKEEKPVKAAIGQKEPAFENPSPAKPEKTAEVSPEKAVMPVAAAVKTVNKPVPENKPAVNKTPLQNPKPKEFFSDEDIKENSIRAALSYFGILFLIPYFKREKSKLCRAHSKQGIAVFVYSVIVELVALLLVLLMRILLVWTLALPYLVYNIAFMLLLAGMAALLIIPVYVGAKAAFNGIYKTVPIVGKYVKKKKSNNSTKKAADKKVPEKKDDKKNK